MSKFTIQTLTGLYDDWAVKIENIDFSKEATKFGTREIIKINFLYSRDKYGFILKAVNDNGDFKGQIIKNGNDVGTCFYTLYKNKTRILLYGEWIEEGECYKSTIELIK